MFLFELTFLLLGFSFFIYLRVSLKVCFRVFLRGFFYVPKFFLLVMPFETWVIWIAPLQIVMKRCNYAWIIKIKEKYNHLFLICNYFA